MKLRRAVDVGVSVFTSSRTHRMPHRSDLFCCSLFFVEGVFLDGQVAGGAGGPAVNCGVNHCDGRTGSWIDGGWRGCVSESVTVRAGRRLLDGIRSKSARSTVSQGNV